MRDGIAGLMLIAGGTIATLVDILAIIRAFSEFNLWIGMLLAFTPPGWLIAPFATGLGIPFVISMGLVGLASAISKG